MSEGWREIEARAAEASRGGDRARAVELYVEAATKGADAGEETPGWAHAMRHAAELQCKLGDLDIALTNARAVVAFYREQAPSPLEMANALRIQALAEEATDKVAEARKSWGEARELYGAVGVDAGVQNADERLLALSGR